MGDYRRGVFVLKECFFFFKQKTAYELRISDWSSDVCSSDLTSAPEERGLQNTDLACDSTEGVMGGTVVCKGNVTLQRGDQFLHADSLRFDSENSTYTADGNVRYQDS